MRGGEPMIITCDDCGREFDEFDRHAAREVLDEIPDHLRADAVLYALCGGCSTDGTAVVRVDKRLLNGDSDE